MTERGSSGSRLREGLWAALILLIAFADVILIVYVLPALGY